jgi:hypothetical protein
MIKTVIFAHHKRLIVLRVRTFDHARGARFRVA